MSHPNIHVPGAVLPTRTTKATATARDRYPEVGQLGEGAFPKREKAYPLPLHRRDRFATCAGRFFSIFVYPRDVEDATASSDFLFQSLPDGVSSSKRLRRPATPISSEADPHIQPQGAPPASPVFMGGPTTSMTLLRFVNT